MKKIILIGFVGKDAEAKNSVASFTLATSESYKNKSGERVNETEWHNIKCFGKLSEFAEKYVKKGDQIYVEGKFKTRSWEKDGSKQYATYIQVETIKMLGGKKDSEESAPTYESTVKPNQSVLPPTEYATQAPIENDGDDMPF